MTYSLWSRGELLGESALDYVRVIPRLRTGDLHPTEKGLKVFERLTQTRADIYYSTRRWQEEPQTARDDSEKTLYADLAAQVDQYEAVALELRGSDGSVIPTEDIHVSDTHYLLDIARESEAEDESLAGVDVETVLDAEVLAELEDELAAFEEDHPPWALEGPEREPARFQLFVNLIDEWAIP